MSSDDATPAVLLFTPGALHLFGVGLARYHPLGLRELATHVRRHVARRADRCERLPR